MRLVRSVKGGVFAGIAAVERLIHPFDAACPKDLGGIREFLLLQYPGALGTAVHSTPLIPALRRAVPGCVIAVAASGFALDVFRNNPGVDRLIPTANPLKDLKSAVRTLRREYPFRRTPHATLTSTGNERTLIAAQAILSGASIRVGFTVAPQLYYTPLRFDPAISQISNNLRIIEALGHSSIPFEPELFCGAADLHRAREILALDGVREGQLVAAFVTQTSPTQRKGWRAERFRAAAEYLRKQYGAHVAFVGTKAESGVIDELRSGLGFPTTNAAGRTTLSELAALMSLCGVGLTLDTGPMHVGRAVGLPMVIIAPAWSPPIEWLPVGNKRYRILRNADMPSAPADYIIDEVSVAQVTSALDDLITSYPCRDVCSRT